MKKMSMGLLMGPWIITWVGKSGSTRPHGNPIHSRCNDPCNLSPLSGDIYSYDKSYAELDRQARPIKHSGWSGDCRRD
jgi:hypothetical protein